MSDDFYAGTMKYNLIYVMEIPDENHKHFLKIGEHDFTSPSSYKQLLPNCDELNKQAKIRINQFTRTAFVHCNLLYTELARVQVRLSDGTIETRSFSDKDVHSVLDRAGYEVRRFFDTDKPSEWYKVDLPTAIAAIGANGMAAMGKVMGAVKPKLTGRADMGKVSALIKQKLTA